MSNEFWVEITGFEHYQISNHGRVRNSRGHILRPKQADPSRPYRVALYDGQGGRFDKSIHVMMAEYFLFDYKAHTQVGFKDGDVTNHMPSNLFMMGCAGRPRYLSADRNYNGMVRNVTLSLVFTNAYEAAEYIQGDASSVYKVLRGDRKHHKGYIFEYVTDKDYDKNGY